LIDDGRFEEKGAGDMARHRNPEFRPSDNRLQTTDHRLPNASDLAFAVQIFLEKHLAPILMVCRWLLVGYAYRRIPLTQGKFARVAPQDYAALAQYKWCAAKQGRSWYAVRTEGNRQLRMHRVIMNAPPGLVVDHIDHNGLNNVPRNLRNCPQSQNARNQRPQEGCSSQYIGVTWLKRERKWWARLQKDGHQQSLGLYDDEREAAKVRDTAAIAQHGEFASLNFSRHTKPRIQRIISGIRWTLTKPQRHKGKNENPT
jgi:hypothetical protein